MNLFTPSSTVITYAQDSVNYIWASVTGFFYASGANGMEWIIVTIVLFGIVCIVVAAIKHVMPFGYKHGKL